MKRAIKEARRALNFWTGVRAMVVNMDGLARYDLIEHEACGYRTWSNGGMLPEAGPCPKCGEDQPAWTLEPVVMSESRGPLPS